MSREIRKIEPNARDCDGCLCFDCANRWKYRQCDLCPCPADHIAKISGECDFKCSLWHSRSMARNYCRLFRIAALYHITPWENLESILQLTLLCRNRVVAQRINHKGFAYESALHLRTLKELGSRSAQNYVPLFFHQLPPMLRKLEQVFSAQEIMYICVNPEILGEAGVLFTDRNYASTGCQVFYSPADLPKLQWKIIQDTARARTQTEESRIQGAEVLVLGGIDPGWFTKIVVYDEGVKTLLSTVLPKTRAIPIEVKPEFYF